MQVHNCRNVVPWLKAWDDKYHNGWPNQSESTGY